MPSLPRRATASPSVALRHGWRPARSIRCPTRSLGTPQVAVGARNHRRTVPTLLATGPRAGKRPVSCRSAAGSEQGFPPSANGRTSQSRVPSQRWVVEDGFLALPPPHGAQADRAVGGSPIRTSAGMWKVERIRRIMVRLSPRRPLSTSVTRLRAPRTGARSAGDRPC